MCHLFAFADILKSITSNPVQTVSQATQIGDGDLAQLWRWNRTVPPAIDRCIHEIVIERARQHPDSPAVYSWDGELTYGELDSYSTCLATHIAGLGVGVGKAVLLCFEKSMWTVVAVLAVMKAGGALVLTDPSQPQARLRTMATEARAHLILTSRKQDDLGSRIAAGVDVIPVDRDTFTHGKLDTSFSLQAVPASATLYMIFTSGSTGKPKGVVISHSNYTSGALPRAQAVGYGAHSRVLDFPSYAFDVSIDCMLCTLAQGGCICVPSEEARINNLSGAIRDLKANMAHMTPSVARVLDPDILPSLEVLGLGGESVSARDASAWGQKTKVIIAYGPSECTVGCTINNDIVPGRTYTSIGKGVGGSTWIVDPEDDQQLMPVGAVGELLIEGPIVGVGYLNEPEKTASVFIEDPVWLLSGCSGAPGRRGRLYKTGDLVRYDPDGSGSVVFVGRADQQVKLRGQRVELGEIEHHLSSKLPLGTKVVAEVITPGGNSGEPTLVAFITEEKNDEKRPNGTDKPASFSAELIQTLAEINEPLAAVLPRYMMPNAYIPLHEMPLLVSCKTDRKQLRAIGASLSRRELASLRVPSAGKAKPQSDAERSLQELWAKLFGTDIDIGRQDNFFDIGGDSLRAMKLVAVARKDALGLTVADIFRFPNLADMALTLVHLESKDMKVEIPEFSLLSSDWRPDDARSQTARFCGLGASSIEDVYPCTPLQEGFMALSAKVPETYVAQRVIKMPDLANAQKLQAAFERAAADCAVLRTRIVQVPGRGLMQVIVRENIAWASGGNLGEYLTRDRDDQMGLGTRLARFAVIVDNMTNDVHFVLTMHHALYDGWSMPLVVERINRAYHDLKTERPAPFKAFIKYLSSIDRSKSETYWRSQLQGANRLQFPVLPRPGYQTQPESLLEHYVPLKRTSSASSTSIATAIRGAWAIVAAQYCASDDVIVGETLTGRNAPVPGAEQVEGPMITTVPVRIRLNRRERVSEYLQRIHNQTIHRIPHEHMGLQHIRRLSPDAREACELRTGLVIHPKMDDEDASQSPEDAPANGFVPAGDAEAAQEALKFNSYALMLVFTVDTEGFLIMASFDSQTVDVPQMEGVLHQLGRTVQFLCEQTEATLYDMESPAKGNCLDQWALSSIGPKSLDSNAPKDARGDAVATWITNPDDPQHLVPVGAVGELLLEGTSHPSHQTLECPGWLSQGYAEFSGRQARLYRTGHLAKYNSDGSLFFFGKTEERIKLSDTSPQRVDSGTRPGNEISEFNTPKENILKGLWSRVLGIAGSEFDRNDSFFDLGGDSISAMKLVSEARADAFELTVAKVFRHRSLSDMADILQPLSPAVNETAVKYTPFTALDVADVNALVSDIQPKLSNPSWKIADVLPTRPLQEIAVKGTVQLPRYSTRYELFYLDAAVDERRLLRCCRDLVLRNEILRTVFVENADSYFGVVLSDLNVPVVQYEIEDGLESFSRKVCEVDVQEQMPLGSSFVKFLFIRSRDGRSCLAMRISHAQYDEICLPVLLRQLSALYEGTTVPETQPFSSYVGHLIRENIPESIEYWRELLRGSAMSVVRPDRPIHSRKAVSVNRSLSISARLKQITVATLPTAAWALCLARHLATADVTFGEVVSGRNTGFPNCEGVMGPCWQYIPVRVRFERGWAGIDLLNYIQNQHITSARFEGIGLKEVVKHCTDWPRDVDWFDSVVHQDVAHVESLQFLSAKSQMETVYPHLEPLREWKIQAFAKDDELCIEIVTFESWLDEATGLLDNLEVALKQLVNDPSSSIF